MLLVGALLLSFSMSAWAQKVSLNFKNTKVETVLSSIKKQTGMGMIFSDQILDVNRAVSIQVKDAELAAALNQLLDGTNVSYEIRNGRVYFVGKKEVQQPSRRIKVRGTVTDVSGEPIIGANVMQDGTVANGTITDIDGAFELEVPGNATLRVTFIGYTTQEIGVKDRTSLSISLQEDTEVLDEVVVVGYGTMKKKDLSGSISAIRGENLASRKVAQLSTALQGAVAGMMVTREGNAPGATGTIRVRGVTTIGDSNPLVLIDGVPGNIDDVNSNDVESISVLKDAASSSIYGSRAAAGVILVTTKRANEKSLSIGYNFEYGFEIPVNAPKQVGVQRYLEAANEVRYNDNKAGGWYQAYSEDDVNNWVEYNKTDPDKYPMTNWKKLILKDSAPRQTHTISVSGGSKHLQSNASFVYDKTDGLYGDLSYERFMIRSNNDFIINKYIGATLDFNFRRAQKHRPYAKLEGLYDPMPYPAIWLNGQTADGKNGSNVYAQMKDGGFKDDWYNRVGGRAAINITPLDGLKFSAVIAPTYSFDKSKYLRKAVPYYSVDDPTLINGYMQDFKTTMLTENRNDDYNVTIQAFVNYEKVFGKHSLSVMGGYETYYWKEEKLKASRDQYEVDNFPYLDIGPMVLRDNGGNASELAYRSWFGRVAYNYDNRYLLQANVRYDGSSRFHSDHRWGVFPSFSVGWVISEEKFMKNANMNWLSFLKLRASYGTLGNERVGSYYPYQASINFRDGLFYQNDKVVSELSAAQWDYAVQNLTWETTSSMNFAVDATFLNNRLRFTAEYYKKETKDMLLALEIPDYVGFGNPQVNAGEMHTNGFDLELGWNDQIGELNYGISVNFSDFVSKMGDLNGTEFLGDQVKKKGSEFNEWYGYLSDGLILTEEDLQGPKMNDNIQLGDVKYRDISGPDGVPDGKISPEYDRVLLGGSLPRFLYGGTISLGYKGLDFSAAIQGVGKQNVRLTTDMIQPLKGNWLNMPALIDGNYWSEKNTSEKNAKVFYPRMTNSNATSNYAMSDYWIFNGRYFRLKNITLGYTLPLAWTQKVMMKQVRIYVSANDLFCINKYPKGWDPESGGEDLSAYPITTSVLFGLSVKF